MSRKGLPEELQAEIREEAMEWASEQIQRGTYPSLTPEMLRAIYVMVHPLSGDTISGWAAIAGVSRNTWSRHRDKPEWQQAVDALRAKRRGRQLWLADRVIEGLLLSPEVDPRIRLAAARTIYEREGQFVKKVETKRVEETPAEREARRRMQQRLHRSGAAAGGKLHIVN